MVQGPLPSLVLIQVCESIRWAHLPVAGGLYDQHPDFISDMVTYLGMKYEYEAKQAKEDERKQAAETATIKRGRRPRTR